jgi:hypothetical protein
MRSRSTVITGVGFKCGLLKKRQVVIPMFGGTGIYSTVIPSDSLPKKLADGESADYRIPLGHDKEWLIDFCDKFITSWIDVLTLRLLISTSNSGTFSFHPEKTLKKMMLDLLRAKSG